MQRIAETLESRFSVTATRPGEVQQQTCRSLEAALRVARTLALRGFIVCVRGIADVDDVGEIYVTAEHAA